jgi:hypothetical protein
MSCAIRGHTTKLKQSIFAPFDIYGHSINLSTFLFGSKNITVFNLVFNEDFKMGSANLVPLVS